MPDAPVYPGSTLIDQSSSGGIYWLADQNYVSSDAPDKIVDFYIDQMFHYGYAAGTRCPVRSLGGECYGNAQPFGQYSVYLDRDSSLNNQSTKFTIEFRWRGCGWDI